MEDKIKETNLLDHEQIKTYLTAGVFPFILGFFIGILELIIWTLKHKYNISWLPSNLTKTLFIEHMPTTTIMLFFAITAFLLLLSNITKIKCIANITKISLDKLEYFTSFSSWVILGLSIFALIATLFFRLTNLYRDQASSTFTIGVLLLILGLGFTFFLLGLKYLYNIRPNKTIALILFLIALFATISIGYYSNRTIELNFSNEEMNKIKSDALSNNKTPEDFIKSIVIEKTTKEASEK